MRRLLQICFLLSLCCPAFAEDKTFHAKLSLAIGEKRQVGIFGGHSFDCNNSVPASMEILENAIHGVLSQRDSVDYVARNSISHTCEGHHFLGTAVDYTAKSVGADLIRFDAVFNNGRTHYVISVVNR